MGNKVLSTPVVKRGKDCWALEKYPYRQKNEDRTDEKVQNFCFMGSRHHRHPGPGEILVRAAQAHDQQEKGPGLLPGVPENPLF